LIPLGPEQLDMGQLKITVKVLGKAYSSCYDQPTSMRHHIIHLILKAAFPLADFFCHFISMWSWVFECLNKPKLSYGDGGGGNWYVNGSF
jgi:hypothetical protein